MVHEIAPSMVRFGDGRREDACRHQPRQISSTTDDRVSLAGRQSAVRPL